MNDDNELQRISETLRAKARTVIDDDGAIDSGHRDVLRSVLHEMETYEHELELQNQELVRTQEKLREAADVELDAANHTLKTEVWEREQIQKRLQSNQRRLRALAQRLSRVEEDQRRKLASELHDLIGQTLVIANMRLGLLERDAADISTRDQLRAIRESVRGMVDAARSIISELRPRVLDEQDFETAVSWLVHHMSERYSQTVRTTLRCELEIDNAAVKEFLFRSIRELLSNVALHSGTEVANLRVEVTPTKAIVEVRDNGRGFDVETVDERGFGLFEISERVEALGGEFTLQSTSGQGTAVSLTVPL